MKQILIICLLGMLGITATAQIRRTVAAKPKVDSAVVATPAVGEGANRKEVLRELGLNRQQLKKLKEMRQATKQQREAIEADTKLTDMERRQRLQELRRQQMAQTDSVLTPEQRKKMVQIRQDAIKEKRAGKQAAKNGMGEMELEDL